MGEKKFDKFSKQLGNSSHIPTSGKEPFADRAPNPLHVGDKKEELGKLSRMVDKVIPAKKAAISEHELNRVKKDMVNNVQDLNKKGYIGLVQMNKMIKNISMDKQYKIEGRNSSGNWDESVVGNDSEANTFATIKEAEAMIPELIKNFSDDDNPPTESDFRIVER